MSSRSSTLLNVANDSLWVFGYGSLVWRPAFPHRRTAPATIEGWVRRFWQGSTDHRGVPTRPGRVVTILENEHPSVAVESPYPDPCWGSAYEVPSEDRSAVLKGLDHRERGGYTRFDVEITLNPESGQEEVVTGLTYVARTDNQNYLGPAPVASIAEQILGASGPSGTNPEYVFELAESLRRMDAIDAHVFEIEAALMRLMQERAS